MATLSRNDAVMMSVMTLTKTIGGDVVMVFVGRVIYQHNMYKIGTVANIRWRCHLLAASAAKGKNCNQSAS